MSSQSSHRRLIVGAVAGAGLALSLGLGSASADPETPTPTAPAQPTPAAGTPGLQLTGGAAGGTPTVPGKQATGAQAPSYAYVLDRLSAEFTRGSGAGQVANLLDQALKLRAQGFPPKPADLAAVQAAVAKRPNQGPLIGALQATVTHQHQLQSQAGSGPSQNQPQTGFGISQGTWNPGNPMIQDDPIFPMPGRN